MTGEPLIGYAISPTPAGAVDPSNPLPEGWSQADMDRLLRMRRLQAGDFSQEPLQDPFAGPWWTENSAAEFGGNLYHGPNNVTLDYAPQFWWSNPTSGGRPNPDYAFSSFDPTTTPPTLNAPPVDKSFADLWEELGLAFASPIEQASQLTSLRDSGYLGQFDDYSPEIDAQLGEGLGRFWDEWDDASRAASLAGIMSVAAPVFGGMLAPALAGSMGAFANFAPAVAAGGIAGGTQLALGANLDDALRSGAITGGMTALPIAAAPLLSDLAGKLGGMFADAPIAFEPITSTAAQPKFTLNPDAAASIPATTQMGAPGMLPFSVPTEAAFPLGALASGMSADDLDIADAQNRQALEAGDELPSEPAPTTPNRYAQLAKKVLDLLGKDEKPEGAPQRDEGESDAAYAAELGSYMGLDAQAMADAGLTPGTPEYYEYIMTQADSVILRTFGNNPDLDPEALAAQFRSKTAAEQQDVMRALYVRGQMDLLMGGGTYDDPVSGNPEAVIAPAGGMINPGLGAYQRGLARDVQGLASSADPYSTLQGMLGRTPDFFGMQGAADRHFEAAKLNETQQMEEELRRRRGMISGY